MAQIIEIDQRAVPDVHVDRAGDRVLQAHVDSRGVELEETVLRTANIADVVSSAFVFESTLNIACFNFVYTHTHMRKYIYPVSKKKEMM